MRSNRARIAIVVLVLWVAGLGVLAQSELFRPHLERLADAAIRVNQTMLYYGVSRAGGPVGYAQSVIDTTQSEIIVSDLLITETSGFNERPPTQTRLKIRLSRRFRLKQFESSIQTTTANLRQSGTVLGDTALSFQIMSGDKLQPPQTIRVDGAFLLPRLVPLAIALAEKLAVGNKYAFPVFDPARQSIVQVKSTINAESLFVLPDSAIMDSVRHLWVPVRTDTVRAWRVSSSPGGFDGWIDESGHPVETTEGGSELKRLTYEQAFENWMLITGRAKTRPGEPMSPPPSARGRSSPRGGRPLSQ